MALTRTEAADYAASEFQALLEDAGITADEATGLKSAIDTAMRLREIPIAGPVPDGEEVGFLAILDWSVLRRIERTMAQRVDVSVDGPTQSKKYSQAVAQVRALREEAWAEASAHIAGDVIDDDWGVGYVSLDLIAFPPRSVF